MSTPKKVSAGSVGEQEGDHLTGILQKKKKPFKQNIVFLLGNLMFLGGFCLNILHLHFLEKQQPCKVYND